MHGRVYDERKEAETMYQIGEFSKMTKLTVKTLRYYDEAGILTPSCREESGYRLYSDTDYEKAKLIVLLRGFDFSIAELRDIMEHYENRDDLRYYLAEKKVQIEARIRDCRSLMRQMDAYLSLPKQEENSMNYKVEIRKLEPVLIASVRFQGRYEDTGKYVARLFGAVKSRAAGAPFNLYYDGEYRENDADIEVCVPVREPVSAAGIESRRLPAMEVIVTTHVGPYDKLGDAYKAVNDFAAENHLEMKTPSRETYVKGPGMIFKGNPNKYQTEIAVETVR